MEKEISKRTKQKKNKKTFRNHTFLYDYHCIIYSIYFVVVFYRETTFVI